MSSETKKTILVVDDTKINIDILLELLGDMYHVLVSLSAIKAIEILKKEHVDIILLDIHMPNMSGYEACKVLKSMEETKHIPIMFITSNSDEESIDIAFEAGGIDYITKPFKTLELLARIKTHLNTQALIKELEVSHREMKLLASQDYMT
ncbi:response regulator, partial [Sulfurimonas sp. SAG-AH-194-L11]